VAHRESRPRSLSLKLALTLAPALALALARARAMAMAMAMAMAIIDQRAGLQLAAAQSRGASRLLLVLRLRTVDDPGPARRV
jgi:hypothetical protein